MVRSLLVRKGARKRKFFGGVVGGFVSLIAATSRSGNVLPFDALVATKIWTGDLSSFPALQPLLWSQARRAFSASGRN